MLAAGTVPTPCTSQAVPLARSGWSWSGAPAGDLGVRQKGPPGGWSGRWSTRSSANCTLSTGGDHRGEDTPERRAEGGKQVNQGTELSPAGLGWAHQEAAGTWPTRAETYRLNCTKEGPACPGGAALSSHAHTPALFQGKPTPTEQAFQGEPPRATHVSAKGREDKERSNRAQQRSPVPYSRIKSSRHSLPQK